MPTISEQISAFENKRGANAARMKAIMDEAGAEGSTLDAEKQDEFDGLAADNEAIDGHLKRLKAVESLQAETAKPVRDVTKADDAAAARGGVVVKTEPKLPPGIAFARIAKCKAIGRLENARAVDVAKALYGEQSIVTGFFAKGSVVAGTTSDTTWAGNLISDEGGAFADFIEFLRPQTILGKFGANGVPSLRRVPFRTPLVGQTSGGDAYWVGEGKPKPLTKFDFSRTTLEPLKVANIAVVTEEVLRDSSPSAEMLVRDSLAAAVRQRLDTDFVDPGKSASQGVSPASITYNVSAIGSTGNDADDVRADCKAVFGSFIADNNAPTSGVWIMPATIALALSLMQNPLGQAEFPGITMNGGTLFGLPVIVSEYVPTVSAGAYVILANAQDIYLADDGGVNVDMSREASLEMKDTGLSQDATAGTGASLVSLWQTNAVGFRAERTINWAKRRSGAVAVLDEVNWGSPSA